MERASCCFRARTDFGVTQGRVFELCGPNQEEEHPLSNELNINLNT